MICVAPNHSAGFTLLEVLVAIVIISIGLLGLLQLQTASLANTQVSAAQTQAAIATQSMIGRLEANPAGVQARDYDTISTETVEEKSTCNNPCSAKQMARYDVTQWKRRLAQELPNGKGYIDRANDPDEQPRFVITIRWTAKNKDIPDAANGTDAKDHGCSDGESRCRRTLVTP